MTDGLKRGIVKYMATQLRLACLSLSCLLLATSCSKAAPTTTANTNYQTPLLVGNRKILVAVANTDAERQLGLSYQNSINDSQGMLFDFSASTTPAFWMIGMKFNLDLVWITDGKIVGITPNVPAPVPGTPSSRLPLYYPPVPIDHVLEVNAGWCQRYDIHVGDNVNYSFPHA